MTQPMTPTLNRNPNRPKKGSSIKVAPITSIRTIKNIKEDLKDKPRDLCLFTLGINTNLRASDLKSITVVQVKHLQAADELVLKEKKTGKERRITLNNAVIKSIQSLLSSRQYEDDDPLFLSQRGGKALTVQAINVLVKDWCRKRKLKENYGSHTLRKTFGYQQRVKFGTSLPELMVMFNHSSQKQTLDYLCIQPQELKEAYMNEL